MRSKARGARHAEQGTRRKARGARHAELGTRSKARGGIWCDCYIGDCEVLSKQLPRLHRSWSSDTPQLCR